MSEDYKAVPASVHRSRGRCCKSACIHCPYGLTLKKYGLTFEKIQSFDDPRIEQFSDLIVDKTNFTEEDYAFIFLKDTLCGFMRKDKLLVRELALLPDFRDQGLDKPVVESYYFY